MHAQSLLLGLKGHDLDDFSHQLGQVRRQETPRNLVRLDACDVEDVRDQMHEAAQVLIHYMEIVLPVGRSLRPTQVVETSPDGGQRGTQFVRHGGQEVGLEAVQGLEFLVGLGQLAGRALHLFLKSAPSFLQFVAHDAQGLPDAIHFVAAPDANLPWELPPADAVGHGLQRAQGPQHQMTNQKIQGQHREHDERQGG